MPLKLKEKNISNKHNKTNHILNKQNRLAQLMGGRPVGLNDDRGVEPEYTEKQLQLREGLTPFRRHNHSTTLPLLRILTSFLFVVFALYFLITAQGPPLVYRRLVSYEYLFRVVRAYQVPLFYKRRIMF